MKNVQNRNVRLQELPDDTIPFHPGRLVAVIPQKTRYALLFALAHTDGLVKAEFRGLSMFKNPEGTSPSADARAIDELTQADLLPALMLKREVWESMHSLGVLKHHALDCNATNEERSERETLMRKSGTRHWTQADTARWQVLRRAREDIERRKMITLSSEQFALLRLLQKWTAAAKCAIAEAMQPFFPKITQVSPLISPVPPSIGATSPRTAEVSPASSSPLS